MGRLVHRRDLSSLLAETLAAGRNWLASSSASRPAHAPLNAAPQAVGRRGSLQALKHSLRKALLHATARDEVVLGVELLPDRLLLSYAAEGHSHTYTHLLSPEELATPSLLARTLKKACQTYGGKAKHLAWLVPQSHLITQTVTLPSMDDASLKQAASLGAIWQNIVVLPEPIASYRIAYEVLQRTEEDMQVRVTALLEKEVEDMAALTQEAGLVITDLVPTGQALQHLVPQAEQDRAWILHASADGLMLHTAEGGLSHDIYLSDEETGNLAHALENHDVLRRIAHEVKQARGTLEEDGTKSPLYLCLECRGRREIVRKLQALLPCYALTLLPLTHAVEALYTRMPVWSLRNTLKAGEPNQEGVVTLWPQGGSYVHALVKRARTASAVALLALLGIGGVLTVLLQQQAAFSTLQPTLQQTAQIEPQFAALKAEVAATYKQWKEEQHLAGMHQNMQATGAPLLSAYQAIGTHIPEGLWLQTTTYDNQHTLTLSGQAYGEQAILQFVQLLHSLPEFASVRLKTIEAARVAESSPLRDRTVRQFLIECELVLSDVQASITHHDQTQTGEEHGHLA